MARAGGFKSKARSWPRRNEELPLHFELATPFPTTTIAVKVTASI
jgi:hypothetical protein